MIVAAAALAGWLHPDLTDLHVYRHGGRALLDGLSPYAADDPVTGLPFTYPPFAAVVMLPLAVLPAQAAAAVWTAASVAALGAVVVVALREAHLDARGWLVAALVIGAVALEPVWQNLSFGQVNLVLMAAVVADLTRPERRFSGVLVGLAAAVKLTPLVFVVLLLLVGRRGAAGRAALTFLVTVAVGFAVAPGAAASYWTLGLLDADRVGPPWLAHNQSAYGVLTRLLGESPPAYVWLGIAVPLGGAMLLSLRRGGVAASGCSAPESRGSRCCSPRRSPGRTTGCGPSPSLSRSGRTLAGWRRGGRGVRGAAGAVATLG